ncbi:hypothetical protein CORC01_13022 [Colletotrichum orchidophilum]|uniref:Uncharacterized protein n=1 Tax=Colletotrichum orchidophilum TaxID=1209926 RepID=A0A1G4ARE4_9PEZI|nr:uncharacterized protein CORC01_13022 [Colletotrichum orchidophilum]OHE91676.1 hypothetical protein CORC01_13022 [Colletotrichum orchidophilum]
MREVKDEFGTRSSLSVLCYFGQQPIQTQKGTYPSIAVWKNLVSPAKKRQGCAVNAVNGAALERCENFLEWVIPIRSGGTTTGDVTSAVALAALDGTEWHWALRTASIARIVLLTG